MAVNAADASEALVRSDSIQLRSKVQPAADPAGRFEPHLFRFMRHSFYKNRNGMNRLSRQIREKRNKTSKPSRLGTFSQLFLCLSRACLGKKIVLYINGSKGVVCFSRTYAVMAERMEKPLVLKSAFVDFA